MYLLLKSNSRNVVKVKTSHRNKYFTFILLTIGKAILVVAASVVVGFIAV